MRQGLGGRVTLFLFVKVNRNCADSAPFKPQTAHPWLYFGIRPNLIHWLWFDVQFEGDQDARLITTMALKQSIEILSGHKFWSAVFEHFLGQISIINYWTSFLYYYCSIQYVEVKRLDRSTVVWNSPSVQNKQTMLFEPSCHECIILDLDTTVSLSLASKIVQWPLAVLQRIIPLQPEKPFPHRPPL